MKFVLLAFICNFNVDFRSNDMIELGAYQTMFSLAYSHERPPPQCHHRPGESSPNST